MNSSVTTLVLGASGATGRLVCEQLLHQGHNVIAIVRSKERFNSIVPYQDNLKVVEGTILDLEDSKVEELIQETDAVACCLGHNMSFKGIYGKPHKLVTDSVKKVCHAISSLHPSQPKKVILMNSIGVAHPDGTDDPRPMNERMLINTIRALVPPHSDNEDAAAYLCNDVGKKDSDVEWVVVRPDDLIDADVSKYEVTEKPPETGLFGGGQTSRSNVAHFMCDLILNDTTFNKWKGLMPVPTNMKAPSN